MKKALRYIAIITFIIFSVFQAAHAVAMAGGTIIKKDASKLLIVIKLERGTEKKVYLLPGTQAYKLNQPAIFSDFRVGEYVIMKLCCPLNEEDWQAEVLMDTVSAKQYNTYRMVTPIYNKIPSGGFATVAGAAPKNIPPLSGVYPRAITQQWPNDNRLPSVNDPNKELRPAPAPWGSPAMGQVMSGNPSAGSSGWGSSGNSGWGDSATNYNTPTAPAQPQPEGSSPLPKDLYNLGITPEEGAWAAKPTESAPTMKIISFQGIVKQSSTGKNGILVEDMSTKIIYTVIIGQGVKITDFTTNKPVSASTITENAVVVVSGIAKSDKTVKAKQIKVHK